MPNPNVFGNALGKPGERRRRGRCPVQVVIDDDGKVTVGTDNTRFTMGVVPDDIVAFNKGLVEILEGLRTYIMTNHTWDLRGKPHEDYAKSCLTQLRNKALEINSGFNIGDFLARFKAIQERKQKSLGLTFTASERWMLWWNMVYTSVEGEDPTSTVADERFWGLEYPISISLYKKYIIPEQEIDAMEGIYSAIHEGLQQPHAEVRAIIALVDRVREVYGFKTLALRELGQDPELVLETISADELLQRFRKPSFRYGIVHFACHCENPMDKSVTKAALYLQVSGRPIELSVSKLGQWIPSGGFNSSPLVFLNACETSTLGHLETTSLPSSLMQFNASAVIGTACTVPDDFARAFAEEFYLRLFKLTEEDLSIAGPVGGGELMSNIGEALLATRKHFLTTYKNPLGLAYCLYSSFAEPNMVFRDADSEEVE